MVGAGQLARMTHQAAIALGQSVRVLAADPDDGAALVAADVRIGSHTDLAALRAFADGCEVVTFDHEHVPPEHLRALAADGVPLLPSPEALRYAQDKHAMREKMGEMGLPIPAWAQVSTVDDVIDFGTKVGWPVVLKASRGGYDGKGVWMIPDAAAAHEQVPAMIAAGTPLIVEERVHLKRELSALAARSPFGQVSVWPVVETVQDNGICVEVLAPAPNLPEDRALAAQRLAIDIATELGVVGTLAVELFETTGGELLINELAMRPHNSGHWTIDGSVTSQFEQHIRAVLDYPLGATAALAPAVCMANVLGGADGGMRFDERLHHLFAAEPAAKVHLYGKAVRPGRKIGHVTVLGDDFETVRRSAARAAHWLRYGTEPGENNDLTHMANNSGGAE